MRPASIFFNIQLSNSRVNPNEIGDSFELVKTFHENIQIGIKLDMKENYLYIATLHTITNGKLKHGIANGRLKKFDK